jgi:hypothetical protein
MAAKRKFEPEKVNAALKLLRALPVKDSRKTTSETLHMLKGGILDALDKGYDRTEIRRTIAAAEVVISATTFNDFLAGNLPGTMKDASENGGETNPKRKEGTEKTPRGPEATGNGIAVETENPALEERKTATSENGKGKTVKRHNETMKTPTEQEATIRAMPVKTAATPGSIVVKPDTPIEEL